MSRVHPAGAVRYGLPGLAIGLALAWWSGGPGSRPLAAGPVAKPAEPGGLMAISSPMGNSSSQLLYLVDPTAKAFSVYRVDPGNTSEAGNVKLIGARHCQFDLQMIEYNNAQPEVSSIQAALKAMPK